MPRVLRILNRLAVGGPVLNAAYLTKYMAPDFETLFVVGEREDHEKSAAFLTDQLGIQYTTVAGMGRATTTTAWSIRALTPIIRMRLLLLAIPHGN